MQTTQDEGDESARTARAAGAQGLGKDFYRVEFRLDGSSEPLAWSSTVHRVVPCHAEHPEGRITYVEYCFDKLVFSHMTAIAIMQGADLRNVFGRALLWFLFANGANPLMPDHGPFHVVQGKMSSPADVPPHMKGCKMIHLLLVPAVLPQDIVQHLIATKYKP